MDESDLHLQYEAQQQLVEQLKGMIREREDTIKAKDKELQDTNSKLSKLKLQAKAKVVKMTSQLEEAKKAGEAGDREGETGEVLLDPQGGRDRGSVDDPQDSDTSSITSEEGSSNKVFRAKTKMLKRQLEDKDKVILEKDDIIKVREKQIEDKMAILGDRELIVHDLTEQLEQKTKLIETLQGIREVGGDGGSESQIQEMYAQMVYKDKKMMELNNKILEQDRKVMDLQEFVGEKNEVIRGRDKVVEVSEVMEILQTSLKEKDQSVQDQATLIVKLTTKVEHNEETIALMIEDLRKEEHKLKVEKDKFDLKLTETQKNFEETLQEREVEISKLRDLIRENQKDISTREGDLKELISRHERDIQQIMSKGEVNIHDHVMKMLEQKMKDTNDVLDGKMKVIQVLQTEMAEKENQLAENKEIMKTLKDKLQVTSEQLMLLQANFVDMEAQWKTERERLEKKQKDLIEKQETEKSEKELQMHTLKTTLTQYETAYAQASEQYSALQERYQQAVMGQGQVSPLPPVAASSDSDEVQALRTMVDQLKAEIAQKTNVPSSKSEAQDSDEVLALRTLVDQLKAEIAHGPTAKSVAGDSDEIEALRVMVDQLKAEVIDKTEKLEAAKKSDEVGKGETKMLKMKAQMTSKIKSLEKEVTQLRKGSDLADEVMTLKNRLAELEDEKGHLQLKLVDFEELRLQQGKAGSWIAAMCST
ncbi:uncharacterized protein MCAP_0864-like [Haliotis rubra]|uniref:uncharacterized protein MCAP_0864-like n=1 Tax=Haliotis rubra TaxID=36100 RepID=UPI001EE545D9|nr:uncharacterized protein MCAP_0864-like [Haliotis rubra]